MTDIREQYPLLPLDETLDIAQACGFTHPKAPRTNQPIVMTTDFLVTVGQSLGVTEVARTVKPSGKLQEKRILEKFEIERRYWENRNISWGIVTEQEIPSQLAKKVNEETKKRVPDDVQLKVVVSETPNSWVEYEGDVREVAAQVEQQNPDYVLPVADPMQSALEWTDAAKRQVIAEALRLGLLPFPDKFNKWWESLEEPPRRYVTDDLPDHDLPDG